MDWRYHNIIKVYIYLEILQLANMKYDPSDTNRVHQGKLENKNNNN